MRCSMMVVGGLVVTGWLVGCNTPTKAAPDVTPTPDDCDSSVRVPTGLLSGDPEALADGHADVLGAAPTPLRVRYQWPAANPARNAAFLWHTDVDTMATLLQFGPADGFPDNATTQEGGTFRYGGDVAGEGPYRIHEVKVCAGLEPNTTYRYRVGGEGAWSDVYSFTTPGDPGTFDTFRVAVAGDSRGAYTTWGTVVSHMETHEPDFYMFSGDMVELGVFQNEWDDWFDAAGDVFASKALVPTHGNHEFLSVHYFAQFSLPGNEEWFSIDYGPSTLLSLNDTVRDLAHIETEQRAFIDETLSASVAPWRFALHHQSAYATCSTHGSDSNARNAWSDLFESHGVQVVFAGHNHIYERSVPISGGVEAAEGEGTVYLVTGGAGAPLYSGTDPEWFGAVANPIEHYVIADVSPAGMDVVVYDLSDNVIDEFHVPAP